ncbi:hypothetical protein JCM8202v2_005789 [Rhodotorula sphaerocarpa]
MPGVCAPGNFYMTGFDCRFTEVDPHQALPLLPPIDPVFCAPGNQSCSLAVGAKRPLYAYNEPTNVVWEGNYDRPGYHASWSFPKNGAQEDIFDESIDSRSAGFSSGRAARQPPASPSTAATGSKAATTLHTVGTALTSLQDRPSGIVAPPANHRLLEQHH